MNLSSRAVQGLRWLALLAAACFAIHCGRYALHGEFGRLLWLSNFATLTLALGCATKSRRLAALAFSWLSFCALLWFVDVGFGQMAVDTSVLTHLVSFALAVVAVVLLGVPTKTWARAAFGLLALVVLSRLVTKREQNINLSYTVADGWQGSFTNHVLYLLLLFALSTVLFFGVERLARRLAPKEP